VLKQNLINSANQIKAKEEEQAAAAAATPQIPEIPLQISEDLQPSMLFLILLIITLMMIFPIIVEFQKLEKKRKELEATINRLKELKEESSKLGDKNTAGIEINHHIDLIFLRISIVWKTNDTIRGKIIEHRTTTAQFG
jgi:hypothetical protein